MNLRFCAAVFLFGSAISAAMAGTVPCPDLSAAVQVAACPTEEDLKFTFNGFCSDNARMYSRDTEVCTDYQRYRQLKNVALWESRDGVFQAYVSCDRPAAQVKASTASAISIARKGGITQVVCTYREGVVFTNRTRAQCTVDAKADCASDPASCVANCE